RRLGDWLLWFFHLVCTPPGKQFLPPEIQVGMTHAIPVCDLLRTAPSGAEFHYGLPFLFRCTFYDISPRHTSLSLRRPRFQHPLPQTIPVDISQGLRGFR